MKPINNKSLLHFVFDQMEKLDEKKITTDEAKGQAALAKQANAALKYEIDRARLFMEMDEHEAKTGNRVEFRNGEGKNFD